MAIDNKPPPLPYTVLCCFNCAMLCGMKYESAIGGTVEQQSCQLCGLEKYLREYRTGITAADIRDDMK